MFPDSGRENRNGISLPWKDSIRRTVTVHSTNGRVQMNLVVLATLLLTALMFCANPASTRAQAVWGGINGYVTDTSGAAVSQAIVVVTGEDTGVETKIEADAAGFYNATHLTPGQYSVSVH